MSTNDINPKGTNSDGQNDQQHANNGAAATNTMASISTRNAAYYDFLNDNNVLANSRLHNTTRPDHTYQFHKRILEHYYSLHGNYQVPYNYKIDPLSDDWPTEWKTVRYIMTTFTCMLLTSTCQLERFQRLSVRLVHDFQPYSPLATTRPL